MTLYIASDHTGFTLKGMLIAHLNTAGNTVIDCGPETLDPEDDYPDFIAIAAKKVSEDPENSRAIIIGNSGQGEAMMANRYKGVRAAVYYGGPSEIITASRDHNDANVLSLGAGFLSKKEAEEAVMLWLRTPFSNAERHIRRIAKIDSVYHANH